LETIRGRGGGKRGRNAKELDYSRVVRSEGRKPSSNEQEGRIKCTTPQNDVLKLEGGKEGM